MAFMTASTVRSACVITLFGVACSTNVEPGLTVEAITSAGAQLPVLQGTQFHEFSSHDVGQRDLGWVDRGNKDFNNVLAVCGGRPRLREQAIVGQQACEPGHSGYLIAADDGPGTVARIFFPAMAGGDDGFQDERIRIYLDDMLTPAYDARLIDWRRGDDAPAWTQWTSGALLIHTPLVYHQKLRILLDELRGDALYYHSVDVQRGAVSADPLADLDAFRAQVERPTDVELFNLPMTALAPGRTLVLLDEPGAGTVRRITLQLPQPSGPNALSDLWLRVYWEGSSDPALSLPLAVLFGTFRQRVSYQTLMLSVHERDGALELTSAWPMPFFEHARVQLVNTGHHTQRLRTELALSRVVPAESGHFHAHAAQARGPFGSGARYTVASLTGAGKYVGTLVRMQGRVDPDSATPVPLGFLEGDARFIADGERIAEGTGTEDYFGAGWYFRDGVFSQPMAAAIALTNDYDTGTGSATMARWHLLQDAVEFTQALDVSFEYGADRPATATHYESVAFYYSL